MRYDYEEHPVFESIEDDTRIWRFLDTLKFIDLLSASELHFTRTDLLSDKLEGTVSKYTFSKEGLSPDDLNLVNFIEKSSTDLSEFMRSHSWVCCWHINKYESASMWYQYGDGGVAIQSTFKRLKKSFLPKEYTYGIVTDKNPVYIGRIKYIDYNSEPTPLDNAFHPVMHKRKSFEHERELRAVVADLRNINLSDKTSKVAPSFRLEINTDTLIENIYISPKASSWKLHAIQSIAKKLNFNGTIKQSDLTGTLG